MTDIHQYITQKMQMSHIYQPVMLKTLILNGGEATVDEIAQHLLSYDSSQIEYYGIRTKNMVGKVLTNNGIVEPIKNGSRVVGYKLKSSTLSDADISSLTALCDQKVEECLNARGAALWGHRANTKGYVSGSTRYNVLKRAKYRCELCGAHEKQIALHIDHIVPRNKGGSDDIRQC